MAEMYADLLLCTDEISFYNYIFLATSRNSKFLLFADLFALFPLFEIFS
jgi:hypothetical protein